MNQTAADIIIYIFHILSNYCKKKNTTTTTTTDNNINGADDFVIICIVVAILIINTFCVILEFFFLRLHIFTLSISSPLLTIPQTVAIHFHSTNIKYFILLLLLFFFFTFLGHIYLHHILMWYHQVLLPTILSDHY